MSEYQFMPPLSESDFDALKADIAERGVLIPVEYDDAGNVLDGHHRIKACVELGIAEWPRQVRVFASEADKRTHARQLNLARRHLNQEQRRALIAEDLRDRPERSNRQIAAELGVDHKTVAAVREEQEAGGEIPHHDARVGRDGVKQPARKPSAPRTSAIYIPGDDGKAAVAAAAKADRKERTDAKRAEKLDALAGVAERNAALPVTERMYAAIYADPPWSFEVWSGEGKDRAAENHYPTMTQAEIEAMPVASLAADDCALFMWAVMPQIPEALRVIAAWGFTYKTCAFVWVKQTKDEQRFATGMGYWTRANAEICLLATRGSPPRLNADVHQVVASPRMEHSRKPDEVAARIERLVAGPYIELFARRARPGWDVWGNQAGEAE